MVWGAGVWSRDDKILEIMGEAIKAGRVWGNTYHEYQAGAAFGGYKKSGYGRETCKDALHANQHIKCVFKSTTEIPTGFFVTPDTKLSLGKHTERVLNANNDNIVDKLVV